jgi:8-oxo-dGTP pyrophosphatase MutT (NUDIX family)
LTREGTGSAPAISCGVIVTDGAAILLGHATRSPRWDIPKGLAEPGESLSAAACRELAEETGLVVAETALVPLGIFPYRRNKDLALFVWRVAAMPDPKTLRCTSRFTARDGAVLPEFDRFGVFSRDAALARVGKGMAEILARIPLDTVSEASA